VLDGFAPVRFIVGPEFHTSVEGTSVCACHGFGQGRFGALTGRLDPTYESLSCETVRIRSGAAAVQIVGTRHGQRHIVEHHGSAHGRAEPAALVKIA